MNRPSTRSQLIARAASLALAAALLAPGVIHADALPLYIGDPTANEKPASGILLGLGEGNVTGSLSLAAEKRWGNDYMHARYYSPNLGRFLSVDPVGGTVGSSQSWNRYSYVLNNPIVLVDPRGLAEEEPGNKVTVKKNRMAKKAKISPEIKSSRWTDEKVENQLQQAQDVLWNEANVLISWSEPKKTGNIESLSEDKLDSIATSAALAATREGTGDTPLLFVGDIEGGNIGGQAKIPGQFGFGSQGSAVVGNPDSANPLATGHELGHGVGGLNDTDLGWPGQTLPGTAPNLMNPNTQYTAPSLLPWQVDIIHKNVGSSGG